MGELLAGLIRETTWWDAVGWTGQALFFSRFLVQWIASERKKESVVPVSFWWLSIVGSLICLAYALTTRKLPFIAGYLFNCIPYARNLVLIHRKNRAKTELAAPSACAHDDPVVAVCRRCGDLLGCATCARARLGTCAACATSPPSAVPAGTAPRAG